MNKLITIITPSYNRAHTLNKLYESLLIQENKFRWLIIDDGSKDNTKEVVDSFIENNKIEISYYKKENGGKHTALNYGIGLIDTELTFIVDSDDKLLPNAIKNICEIHKKYQGNSKIGSYSFLRSYSNGKLIEKNEKDEFIANYIDYRIKENVAGDMAEVYKTEVLKKYPFPVFDNERFLSEDVVWLEIGKSYDCVYLNTPIYECEYLEGGLTYNDKPLKFASPYGSMMRGKQLMYSRCGLKENIRGAIIYNAYKKDINALKNKNLLVLDLKEKLLVFLTVPLGVIFRKKWSNSYES